MTTELKQAAQQAVDAFDAFGEDDDFASLFALAQKMRALRTAIQQAEAKTDVRCEGCGYMTHHREHLGCVRAAKQFTHPAPGVPDGYVLVPLQVLHDASDALGNFIMDHGWGDSDMQAMDNLDAYIARHSALTAAQAKKGQP